MMEFYQVHYGGGDYEDEWEECSELYKNEDNANKLIEQLGFKKDTHHDGTEYWEQQDDSYDEPYWVKVEIVKVVD